jgi:hypothetical protein
MAFCKRLTTTTQKLLKTSASSPQKTNQHINMMSPTQPQRKLVVELL